MNRPNNEEDCAGSMSGVISWRDSDLVRTGNHGDLASAISG